MAEKYIPKQFSIKLTDEERSGVSMHMEMGNVEKISELYDLAMTFLKNHALAVLEGKVVCHYDESNNRVTVIKNHFLDNISRNRGQISEKSTRELIESLDTDFFNQS